MRNAMIQLRLKEKLTAALLLAASVAMAFAAGIFGWRHSLQPAVQTNSASLKGEAAVEKLKMDGSYDSLAEAVTAARYQITQQDGRWLAENPAQKFSSSFTKNELRIAEFAVRADKQQASKPQWEIGLKLDGFGYGNDLSEVGEGETIANNNRIEITKSAIRDPQSAITEWYENKPEGLEQGFTLNAPPARYGTGSDGLRLSLQIIGDLNAETANNQAITLKDKQGRTVLTYDKLAAWDADGKQLAAIMNVVDKKISLEVDDREARYPVTIDPMISLQNKLTASDGASQDKLGTSVSIKGNSLVTGAPGDNSGKGSAYVFAGSGASWTQAKLTAPDGSTGDNFGWSVAIDGTTVVVGAPFDDSQRGSAYVFVYANGLWSYQTRLNANDSSVGDGDRFGWSVSLSGNSVVVGAYGDDGNAGLDQGAAYVFVRTGTTWTQQQKLAATDIAAGDQFGKAVAINGDTAVITADQNNVNNNVDQGSAYVFKRNGSVWSQQQTLVASDGAANDRLGSSVALSGNTIIVGCVADDIGNNQDQGSAYVFAYNGLTWLQQSKLVATDGTPNNYFGASVDVSGDIAVVGAYGKNSFQGSAYAFARSGATWSQQQILSPGDTVAGDFFGSSVSVNGNTMVSGASVGGSINQGAAYVFAVCTDIDQLQKLAGDGFAANGESFGGSIAISGDTAAIGAWNRNNHTGIVRIYTHQADNNWVYAQAIAASNGNALDYFGSSVAIDGNTLVVGAPFDDFAGLTDSGSIYVFIRSGNSWVEEINFTASDNAAFDHFGASVAISGSTILVGAYGDDVGQNTDEGSAYVFVRTANNQWVQQGNKLTSVGGNANDAFGSSVALDGDTALVGAPGKDLFGANQRGQAYIFIRSNGGWSQWNQLFASDGAANDRFGASVAMRGDTAVIGSQVTNSNGGSAYVFAFNGVNWAQQQKLKNGPAAFTGYGRSLSVNSDLIIVGAPFTDRDGGQSVGTAYMYRREAGVWSLQKTLAASDGATGDQLGISVALYGETALVGAPFDDIGADVDRGSVYAFGCVSCPAISINPATLPNGSVGNAYNLTLTASGGSGNYQFSLSGGNMPSGLTLSQNGHISGTTTASGTFSFTVTATTPELCSGSKNYTVTINGSCPSFTLNPATLPGGMVGAAYSQTLLPTGGTAPYLFNFSGTLPPGVQLNSQTGTLLGVPTTVGTYNFTVTAIDTNFCQGSKSYSVTIGAGGGISANNLQFYPLAHPVRLLDTRAGATGCDAPGAKILSNTSRTQTAAGRTCDGLTIPANAAALVGNATSVQSGGGSFTLYPSDIAKPNSANSNFAANQILNSLFTVRLGANDGAFKIFVSTDTDIVVDITGYYAPPSASGLYFHPLPKPVRLLDTRAGASACYTPGLPLQGNTDRTQLGTTTCDNVLIPAGAQALTGNATTVSPQANGFLTLYPADAARPLIASANFQPGVNLNSPFMVGLSPSGEFNIYVASTTDLVVDVTGYYSTQLNDANGQGLLFNALSGPVRLLDTRAGQTGCYTPGTPMVGGSPYSQPATGACTNVPATAQAVVGNATTVNEAANGYLTFWPSDANQPFIATSNYRTGITFNRHFTTGLGADGAFKRYAASTTDLVVDLVGYFAP